MRVLWLVGMATLGSASLVAQHGHEALLARITRARDCRILLSCATAFAFGDLTDNRWQLFYTVTACLGLAGLRSWRW